MLSRNGKKYSAIQNGGDKDAEGLSSAKGREVFFTFQLRHPGGGVRREYMKLCGNIRQVIEYVQLRQREHNLWGRHVYDRRLFIIYRCRNLS